MRKRYLSLAISLLALYSWSTQAMDPASEVMDCSPRSTIEVAIALCYLSSESYSEFPPTLSEQATSNIFLVCPVRNAGLKCFCHTGYYKAKESYLAHLNCLTGIYRCSHCKKLYSSSSSLERHKCSTQTHDKFSRIKKRHKTHLS